MLDEELFLSLCKRYGIDMGKRAEHIESKEPSYTKEDLAKYLGLWKEEKELCFIIEEKKIYLEHVLVEYENIPIFFLCKGNETYYIALLTDMEKLIYIVEQLSLLDTYNLLHMPKQESPLCKWWDELSFLLLFA